MNKMINYLTCLGAAILCVGCAASGPKFTEISKTFPPLDPGQGRVYVYRPGTFVGSAVQPDVKLNGERVGSSQPGGFFYFDRPAGQYEISATTEVTRKLSLLVNQGEERFVRMGVSMGFFVGHIYPELVDSDKGHKEIRDCRYTGTPLPKSD